VLQPDAVRGRISTATTQAAPTRAIAAAPAIETRGTLPSGTIKWFNARKGFGFIERPGAATDLFVHVSAIDGNTQQRIRMGQRVEFELGRGRKGDEARRVRLLAA